MTVMVSCGWCGGDIQLTASEWETLPSAPCPTCPTGQGGADLEHARRQAAEYLADTRAYTVGPVGFDDGDDYMAQYIPRHRWNGWIAAPQFDALTVVLILEDANASYDAAGFGEGYEWTFTESGVLVLTWHASAVTGNDDYTEEYAPDEDGLYALGENAWCWIESDESE